MRLASLAGGCSCMRLSLSGRSLTATPSRARNCRSRLATKFVYRHAPASVPRTTREGPRTATGGMNMNRRVVIAAGLVLCALASAAVAGLKSPGSSVGLGVYGPGSYFYGTMATVRGSANPNEYIGCRMIVYAGPPLSNQVFCTAQNGSGNTASCSASGPGNWNPIASITPNSYLEVYFDSNTGLCDQIFID